MNAIALIEQIKDQLPESKAKIELFEKIQQLEFIAAESCVNKIIEDLSL